MWLPLPLGVGTDAERSGTEIEAFIWSCNDTLFCFVGKLDDVSRTLCSTSWIENQDIWKAVCASQLQQSCVDLSTSIKLSVAMPTDKTH